MAMDTVTAIKSMKRLIFFICIFLFIKLSLLFEKSGAEYPACQQADEPGNVDSLAGMVV